jgi:peptidyl-prolyl cis-trans isomerase SurA
VHSSAGWHIVQVIERDTLKNRAGRDSLDADGHPAIEVHARHILVRVQLSEADADRARALAEKVHAQAAKGANFGDLVKRYSKYQGPASADGDLGFVSLGTLQPQIRSGLDTVRVGGISEVLVNSAGFNIFKVSDRKPEREYKLEEIKEELPDAVAELKQREKYDEWIKTLRGKAHIEIRKG